MFGLQITVKHSLSQDDGAGGQVPEETGEVKSRKGSRATDPEREGSPAQLPLACALGFTAVGRAGERRQADSGFNQQKRSRGAACPFQFSLGVGGF